MAFWEKLSEVTKNVTDKTNDMIEIGKLNVKISSAEKCIDEKVMVIGDYFLNLFDQGAEPAEEIQAAYAEIIQKREEIAAYQAQVNELKGVSSAAGIACPGCGAVLQGDAKFCSSCGAKLGE